MYEEKYLTDIQREKQQFEIMGDPPAWLKNSSTTIRPSVEPQAPRPHRLNRKPRSLFNLSFKRSYLLNLIDVAAGLK